MPTSARLEVANSLQITVKTVHSAGRTESSTHTKQNDIDRDRTFLTR